MHSAKFKFAETPLEENIILGHVTNITTSGTARATFGVGSEYSKWQIHLLAGEKTEVLIPGRGWGKRHQPSLNWKDYSTVRTMADGPSLNST